MRLVFPGFKATTTIHDVRRSRITSHSIDQLASLLLLLPLFNLPPPSPMQPARPPYNTAAAAAAPSSEAARATSHMEDDDETSSSSQMLNNNSIASLLYCDEDPLVSTTPPPPPPPPPPAASSCDVLPAPQQQQVSEDHLKELLVDHLARQRFYVPTCRGGYLEHLLPRTPPPQQQQQEAAIIPAGSVSGARSRGVQYIIYAFGRLGLTVATVFNAVNYLDRFLSINCHLRWEAWMVELVSVACLSIACKLDEVNIPSLHHLQMEEVMSHSFLPATVQDMELTLLKALQWRLACVTPYSFLQLRLPLITPHTTVAAASGCTRLLIRSLEEPSFIQFDSSVIASSALRCVLALEDHHRLHQTYGYIRRLIRPDCPATAMDEADDAEECFRIMETLYASCCSESDWNWNTHHHHHQLYSSDDERLWSLVSVIPRPLELEETAGGGGRLINNSRSAVSRSRRRLLFGSSASASAPHQGITQDDNDNTHIRDEDISHTHN